MARIALDKVSLAFQVRQEKRTSLKDFFLAMTGVKTRTPLMQVQALQDVSLELGQGERLGIIGHNGAGKSTLLKLLAGVYTPTSGERLVEGKISSLFELSLGFEQYASGWENIAYRCYLQGETPKTVREKQDAIAEFAELGEFLNMPVRYYSAGMLVRLAFGIATAIEPEVLLIDEVIGAGDAAFQQKARARMVEMMDRAHLMVMVSHDIGLLADMCDRLLWLDHGRVQMLGESNEVAQAYNEWAAEVHRAREQAA